MNNVTTKEIRIPPGVKEIEVTFKENTDDTYIKILVEIASQLTYLESKDTVYFDNSVEKYRMTRELSDSAYNLVDNDSLFYLDACENVIKDWLKEISPEGVNLWEMTG